jgi:glutamate carboxypeptidase
MVAPIGGGVSARASVSRVDVHALRDLVAAREQEFVSDLAAMVNVDCGSYTITGVNTIAERCESRFRAGGWTVERRSPRDADPPIGDLVIGRRQGAGGPSVLLIGHMDTVFDDGTAAERPFRVEGSRALGPGVSDMKGGLLAGFVAMEALAESRFDAFGTVTYVCNPDEEVGSPFSGPVIRELAPAHDVALILECARANGDIVSSRKGVTDVDIEITGRAAHAGVEPEKGRSAIVAGAALVQGIHALNGRWPTVTANTGVFKAGTRPNIVCDEAELQVDVRALRAEALDEAIAAVRALAAEPAVPDVTVDVDVMHTWRPMEKLERSGRLADQVIALASRLGFETKDSSTGGASDANTTSGMGVPSIDGLGPIGGMDHSPEEYLEVDSIVPRTALIAALLLEVGRDPVVRSWRAG